MSKFLALFCKYIAVYCSVWLLFFENAPPIVCCSLLAVSTHRRIARQQQIVLKYPHKCRPFPPPPFIVTCVCKRVCDCVCAAVCGFGVRGYVWVWVCVGVCGCGLCGCIVCGCGGLDMAGEKLKVAQDVC